MIDRRRFLGIGLKASLLLALPGLTRRKGDTRAAAEESPVVLELVRRTVPLSAGLDVTEAGVLIDEALKLLTGSSDYPLDILSSLFPEEKTAGVKVDASAPGAMTATLASALAERLLDVDVPPERMILWDQASDAPQRLKIPGRPGKPLRLRTIAETGGYGRPIRPGGPPGETAPALLSRVAERVQIHATVTALSATRLGVMAPFVIENLALGAASVKGKGTASPGIAAARYAADPALLPRAALHLADLWRVPLGEGPPGSPQAWEAGTVLLSRDAVALTAVAHRILSNTRRARGLGETPPPDSLSEASRLGLGQGDLLKVRWSKVGF